MNNLERTLDSLKISHPFRDVIVTIGGLVFLLFVQIIIEVDLLSNLQNLNFSRIETDLLIIILAFVSGKLLLLLSDFILYIVLFSTGAPIEILWKNWVSGWKIQRRGLLGKELPTVVLYSDFIDDIEVEEINVLEVAAAMKDYPPLSGDIERCEYHDIFLKIALSICFVGMIYDSMFYLIPFIFFLLSIFSNNKILIDMKYEIYKGIVKSNRKNR